MPVITQPPIGVDLVLGSEGGRAAFNPITIKISDTVFYQILVNYTNSGVNGTLRAYKSIDAGDTWIEQNTAGKPDAGNQCGFYYVFHDPTNSSIDVLYRTGDFNTLGPSLIICRFSTATDTWGTPGTAFNVSTIPDNAVIGKFCFYRQATTGTWVVISTSLSFFPSVFRLYRLTYNGAAWSGPTNITTTNADGADVWGGVLDPATDTYYFLADDGGFGILFYQLSVAFVLSTKIALSPPAMHVPSGGRGSRPSIVLFGANSVAVCFTTTAGDVRTFIGTPLAAPAFTTYIIYTNVGSEETTFGTVMVDKDGKLNTFYIGLDVVDIPNLSYVGQSVFDGVAWGAVGIFYDEVTNPPAGVTFEAFHKLDILQLSDGSWLGTTAMGANGEQNNVQWILKNVVAGTATLTLQKVVSSGPTPPSAWTLTADGPTPLVGQGPTITGTVDPGTYALSESIIAGFRSRGFVCVGGTQDGQNIILAAGESVICTIVNDPVELKGGGRGFIHVTPNRFDACLGREYRLYNEIDRYLLSCAKKPDCFAIPEREWGMDDAEDIPTGPPPGAITLNPNGSIPLPAPIAGDVTILQFRVPVGFDGIILGQFHGYYPGQSGLPPAPSFVQGSGDIIWRISINVDRYARDCGAMLVALGSINSESPIPGGIWLKSGDLVRYIVNVPNLSGSLAPGQGSILAGVHGYFWPRK